MEICILIGSADISGGTVAIFQHALYLVEEGHDVVLVPQFPVENATPNWHRGLGRLRFASREEVAETEFDLGLATWWRTVYDLPRINARRHAYFVQSIESRFYADHERSLRHLVDATYSLGLPIITEARWIKEWLVELGNRHVSVVPNGCDKTIFRPDGPCYAPRVAGRLRVLVEGALGVDFKNVARTLALLRKSVADEIWLMTPSPVSWYPGVDRVFSRIPLDKTAEIYRSCDLLVKLSTVEGMFGPPLEMFHCGGTAIVWSVTGHEEYVRNGENAIVVPLGDEQGVLSAVARLKHDRSLLQNLKAGALATASTWPDWSQTSPEFASAINDIMQMPNPLSHEELLNKTRNALRAHVSKDVLSSSSIHSRVRNGFLTWRNKLLRIMPGLSGAILLGRSLLLDERRSCIRGWPQ